MLQRERTPTRTPAAVLAGGLLACLALPAVASAAPFVEFVDRGVPVGGDGVPLAGFRAAVLRVVSDEPITQVEFEFSAPSDVFLPGQTLIAGDLLQRWVDPAGGGDHQPTPGPVAADNTSPTDLNLDSHFLPFPEAAEVRYIREDMDLFGLEEPPFPETPSVRYLNPIDTAFGFEYAPLGTLEVILDVPAEAGLLEFDLAYVVTDSVIGASGGVSTIGTGSGVGAGFAVPEPTGIAWFGALALLGLRRKRQGRGRPSPLYVETLEGRRLLAAEAPDALTASLSPSGDVIDLHWSNVAGETGFIVESSVDGVTWQTAAQALPADSTSHSLPAVMGSEASYRVRSMSGQGDSGPSPTAAPVVDTSPTAIRMEVQATATGVRIRWKVAATGERPSYKI